MGPPGTHQKDASGLDDRRLVERAAGRVAVPRRDVPGHLGSFVLHAPLELLARAALLPSVVPSGRDRARERISMLADGYDRAGDAVESPSPVAYPSLHTAAATIVDAIDAEDADAVDAAAAWLGMRARSDQVTALLAPHVIDRLSAAGHGSIYLALLGRTQPRGLPGQLLRHPAGALVDGSSRRIPLPALRTDTAPSAERTRRLLDELVAVPPTGPPASSFIAPLVEHAVGNGTLDRFLDDDGGFAAPSEVPHPLLRFAAHAMLQGPLASAPYGWTHCLTLAQAPLLLVGRGADHAGAAFIAVAYLAAHWTGHGDGHVDLSYVPAPATTDVAAAIEGGPAAAAAAAWHAPDIAATASVLATVASAAHDAHHVKYTLACLDAAACDPAATRLYLAAAAHLAGWWHEHPDASDPLTG